jgi:hypothetical protein
MKELGKKGRVGKKDGVRKKKNEGKKRAKENKQRIQLNLLFFRHSPILSLLLPQTFGLFQKIHHFFIFLFIFLLSFLKLYYLLPCFTSYAFVFV